MPTTIPPVPLLDLTRQTDALEPALSEALGRVVRSCRFILGPEVQQFELAVAEHLGVPHAVGVASGTDALWLALRAHDIGPGDAVLTSPFTFFATASAIAATGARPVFADIAPDTWNLDPAQVRAALSGEHPVLRRQGVDPARIRAILPVHLYGQPVDLDAFEALGAEFDVPLVEDAAQAMGATYGDRAVGDTAGLACFSFFPSKNLGGFGDGGLVTTRDDALAHRVRQLRAHGGTVKYHHGLLGTNSRLDALQAAVLGVKLPHLPGWVDARRAHAQAYDAAFTGLPGLAPPVHAEGVRHAYHQYTVRCPGRRDSLAKALSEAGVGAAIYYPVPLHRQEALAHLAHQDGDFPHTEDASESVLSLPVFPELTPAERHRVIEVVTRFAQEA